MWSLGTLTGRYGSVKHLSLKVKHKDLQGPVTHTASPQSYQPSGEAERVNSSLWDALALSVPESSK